MGVQCWGVNINGGSYGGTILLQMNAILTYGGTYGGTMLGNQYVFCF